MDQSPERRFAIVSAAELLVLIVSFSFKTMLWRALLLESSFGKFSFA